MIRGAYVGVGWCAGMGNAVVLTMMHTVPLATAYNCVRQRGAASGGE